MDLFFYIMIYIMGTTFGSFLTLAVYRIPLKKDIMHERSFCPNCNHRLEFLDLIPVLSYIFLKGKCRYCGNKVRTRYLILEILSGLIFLLGYMSLNIKFPIFDISKIVSFSFFVFIYVTIALIVGIDKEYRKINKGVIIFGTIMQIMYIVYLYVVEKINIYRYGIYLILMFALLLIENIMNKRKTGSTYLIQILILCTYLNVCVGLYLFLVITVVSILLACVYIFSCNFIHKIKEKSDILNENIKKELPMGLFLGITTIVVLVIENFLVY